MLDVERRREVENGPLRTVLALAPGGASDEGASTRPVLRCDARFALTLGPPALGRALRFAGARGRAARRPAPSTCSSRTVSARGLSAAWPPPSRKVDSSRPARSGTGRASRPPPWFSPFGNPLSEAPPIQGIPKGGNPSSPRLLFRFAPRRRGAPVGGFERAACPRPASLASCALNWKSESHSGPASGVPVRPRWGLPRSAPRVSAARPAA